MRLDGGYALEGVGLSGLHYHMAGQQDSTASARCAWHAGAGSATRGRHTAVWTATACQAETRAGPEPGGYRVLDAARVRARGELVGLSLLQDETRLERRRGALAGYDEDGAVEAGIDLTARRGRGAAAAGYRRQPAGAGARSG